MLTLSTMTDTYPMKERKNVRETSIILVRREKMSTEKHVPYIVTCKYAYKL